MASSDIAFTPSVKAVQVRKGSRGAYAKMEARGGWETTITPPLAAFLAAQNTAFLATTNADGQPYIQHRGGPPGFLRVIDEHTLGWVELSGNRQYITTGNLAENDKACLFVMDYAHRRRIKIWGTAKVVEDAAVMASLSTPELAAEGTPEAAIVFTVSAWDGNCPQHIPQLVDVAEVAPVIAQLRARIAELEKR